MKVLEQWSEDFINNSDSWLELLLPVYHYICYTLHWLAICLLQCAIMMSL